MSAFAQMEHSSAGASSTTVVGDGASVVRTLTSTSWGDLPVKGGFPVRISKSIAPSDQTSARASSSETRPDACSGLT